MPLTIALSLQNTIHATTIFAQALANQCVHFCHIVIWAPVGKQSYRKENRAGWMQNRLPLPRHKKHCNVSHPSRHVELLIVSWTIQNDHPLGHLQQILALQQITQFLQIKDNCYSNFFCPSHDVFTWLAQRIIPFRSHVF